MPNTILVYKNRSFIKQNEKLSNTIINLRNELCNCKKTVPNLPKLNSISSETLRQDSTWTEKDIILDLKQHNNLIPYEGVLGGKMGFYDDKKIFILSDKWVLAWFDDGHIAGYMLLKYQLNKNGISWKAIDSYLI